MRHHLNKTNFPKRSIWCKPSTKSETCRCSCTGLLSKTASLNFSGAWTQLLSTWVFFVDVDFYFFFSLSLPGTFLDLENTTSHMPDLQVQLTYAILKYFLKEFFSCSFKFFEEQSSDSLSFRYYGFPKLRNRGPIQIHFQVIFFLLAKLLRYLLVELAEPAIPESFHSHKVRLPDQELLQRKFTDLLEVLTHLCFTFIKKRHFT